jgi:hypothetical protein
MPSVSKKQKRFMQIACKNKEFADKVDIPQKVACDYYEADQKLDEENIPRFQQALLASVAAEQEMRRRRIAMDDIINHNE